MYLAREQRHKPCYTNEFAIHDDCFANWLLVRERENKSAIFVSFRFPCPCVKNVAADVKINDVVVVMVVAIAVAPGSCRLVVMAKLIIPFSRKKQPAKLGEVLRAIIFKFSSTDQSNWKKLINWARTSLHRSDP